MESAISLDADTIVVGRGDPVIFLHTGGAPALFAFDGNQYGFEPHQ